MKIKVTGFVSCLLLLSTQTLSRNIADSLWQVYADEHVADRRYAPLFALNKYYSAVKDLQHRDSVVNMIIDKCSFERNDTMKVKALRAYFNSTINNVAQAGEHANELMAMATQARNNEWTYEAYRALAKTALASRKADAACKYMEKAFQTIGFIDNDKLKTECLLLLGYYQEQNNQKLEAYDHYMQGLYMANKLEDDGLAMMASQYLASFYSYIKNGVKAEEYKLNQLKILAGMEPFDSLEYMTQMADLADIYFDNGVPITGTRLIRQVFRYADVNKALALKEEAMTIYRSYLIEHNEMNLLANLYEQEYPQELNNMARRDTLMYARLQAFISEAKGDNDLALFYYKKVEERLTPEMTDVFVSNFYRRYGQFLLRRQDLQGAIVKFDSAYVYAKQAGYLPFLKETSHYLDSINYLTGNLGAAYQFAQLNTIYTDSLIRLQKADELLLNELDYTVKQRELQAQRQEDETRRRHNIQYMGIVLAILTSFIILAALGSFKVHKLVLRAMGFFSFIFFFEFIILLADNQIHHATHGEPWKVILIKIVLIAFLLPLHHWLEEKVVHYLSNHKLIDTAKFSFNILRRKKKALPKEAVAKAEEQN